MISKEEISRQIISSKDLFAESINKFLKPFGNNLTFDLHNGTQLDFELDIFTHQGKINPIFQSARPEDAKEIVNIFKDVYNETYPYKEFEDVKEIKKKIDDSKYHWLLYKDNSNNIAGCFMATLDFEKKRGYIGRFAFKRKYQGRIDVMRAAIGTMLIMYSTYREKILLWYGEARTAHHKSQYVAAICGIKPIAFFPNKDVFLNQIESDIMQIVYDEKALLKYRHKDHPKIIPEVIPSFLYSNRRFQLGAIEFNYPKIDLDINKLKILK